jgi:hypothetical protein
MRIFILLTTLALDNPHRIVPQEAPLSNRGKNFSVTLPPSSVNVLIIPAR